MTYTLPELGYAFDALEPHIDSRTMEIHHDKHHAGYVAKLNAAIEGTDLGQKPIGQLISDLDSIPENIIMVNMEPIETNDFEASWVRESKKFKKNKTCVIL